MAPRLWGTALPNPNAPRMPDLEPDQFWFILRVAGYEHALLAWVDSLGPGTVEEPNPDFDLMLWAAVTAKIEKAKFFERDHWMVEDARQALGISAVELDTLWLFGIP
jgi:hypothetical protein